MVWLGWSCLLTPHHKVMSEGRCVLAGSVCQLDTSWSYHIEGASLEEMPPWLSFLETLCLVTASRPFDPTGHFTGVGVAPGFYKKAS